MRLRLLSILTVWLAANVCAADSASDFYAPVQDAGETLSANGIFPHGRKMAYMGYSGNPARDLTNGFTVAGPTYGRQLPYVAACESNGWPVVAHIGLPIKFTAKTPVSLPDKASERKEIQRQVQAMEGFKGVVWWGVTPEELRPWSRVEMNYLATVCETIRENDPLRRPIYLYNPNHRDVQTLAPIARQVDVLAKGCYVNLTNHKHDRAWVRWSVEQEVAAIRAAGRPGEIPLLNPELCKDPEPGEDGEIRTWVRHDVYLGLASGAKGVLIWSLYPRKEVKRTWQLWYDAYAECGRELNGSLGLGQVFLFGEQRSDLKLRQEDGDDTALVPLGGDSVEPTTTSEQERAARTVSFHSWTSAEYAYGNSRWLFVINSASTPAKFVISGWPAGSRAEDAFSGAVVPIKGTEELPVSLAGNEVFAVRFSRE